MRIIAFIFVILWTLCSCEINTYDAHSVAGNYVHESNWQLGGTRSNSRSDGSSYANSYENSFRDGANAVGVAVAGAYGLKTHQSDNNLTGLQNTNATSIVNTKTKADAAVQLGAQKPVITTPPQVVTFPK